ncbi:MAG: acyl-CoA thioesterase domain-containing protein, partial [Oceanobacter sp.]
MRTALAELLDLMNLEPLGDNRFQGQCQDLGYRRLFSGLMMAQAMSAMMLHMRERGFADWLPHSMHSYFLSSGNTDGTVLLELSETRMGRTYANLQVCVSQDGEKLACVSASFSQPEDGFYHQVSSPQVAGPDGIASQDQLSPQWRDSFPERQRHA